MEEKKIYIKNERFMEFIDELATQITEMSFGAETYVESSEVGQENVVIFTEEAQDYYNEMYDEYESMANRMILLHSDNELNK